MLQDCSQEAGQQGAKFKSVWTTQQDPDSKETCFQKGVGSRNKENRTHERAQLVKVLTTKPDDDLSSILGLTWSKSEVISNSCPLVSTHIRVYKRMCTFTHTHNKIFFSEAHKQ